MGKKAKPRRFADNEAMAYGRLLRTSPQKLNLVLKDIRGMDCEAALNVLTFSRRRIAGAVKKILLSAIANAENKQQLAVAPLFVAAASPGPALVLTPGRARCTGRFKGGRTACLVDVVRGSGHLPVAQIVDDLEHLGPRRKRAIVNPLVLIDRHDELEELPRDLTLFSRSANLAAPASGAASAIHAGSAINAAATATRLAFCRTAVRSIVVLSHGCCIGGLGGSLDQRRHGRK